MPGSPWLRVLRGLRPARIQQQTVCLPAAPQAEATDRADPRQFPCSLVADRRVRHPALPRQPHIPTPQTIRYGHPIPQEAISDEFGPLINSPHLLQYRPRSARFEPAPPNEASNTGFLCIPSRLARRTRAIWQYWHVPALSGPLATQTPTPPTGFRLPSASPNCCDNPATKVFHLHSKQQTPHGAR